MQFSIAPFVVIGIAAVTAVYLGMLIGGSEIQELLVIGLAIALLGLLAFVGDYWWAPLLLISALTFRTNFLGFMMTGIDIGIVVLAVLLPMKMAVRRLQVAQPVIRLGLAFWLLLGYLIAHAIIIVVYNKFQGVPLKNIIKAYYGTISPLIFYALLMRYCRPSTVKPVATWMFLMYAFVAAVCIPVILSGAQLPIIGWRHFMFDWTQASAAVGAARAYAPLLLAAAIAFWPASRRFLVRCLLLGAICIAIAAALTSAGRTTTALCFAEVAIFALLRRKLWLVPVVAACLIVLSFAISTNPNALYATPTPVHRALTPFNLSDHQTDIQRSTNLSDKWHEDLRKDSLTYWTSDLGAFLVGHGFKAWDESLNLDPNFTRYYDDAKNLAVQMGRTENALNSVANIFGIVGLVLYGWLGVHLFSELRRAQKLAPQRSFARSLCDFSIVSLVAFAVFAPLAGGPPGMSIIYWQLGLLASRKFLGSGRQMDRRVAASAREFATT